MRELIECAQGNDVQPTIAARELVEAIQIAYDAARGRRRLAELAPIPVRWLGAMAGVQASRVRQLVRERVLVREQRGIAHASAVDWLRRVGVKPVRGRRLSLVPSWWEHREKRWTLARPLLALSHELDQQFDGVELRYDGYDPPRLVVAECAQLDDPAVRVLYADLLEKIEAMDPGA